MLDTDAVAVAFAVAAVAIGLLVVLFLAWQTRATTETRNPLEESALLEIGLDNDGDRLFWRLGSRTDHRLTVDVFSHRTVGSGHPAEWRHELMTEPLVLPAGKSARLPARSGADAYQAAIAWYAGDAPENDRDSMFVTIDDA